MLILLFLLPLMGDLSQSNFANNRYENESHLHKKLKILQPAETHNQLVELLASGQEVIWLPTHLDLEGNIMIRFLLAFRLWQNAGFLEEHTGINDFTFLDAYLIADYYGQKPIFPIYDAIDPETGEVSITLKFDEIELRKIRVKYAHKINRYRKQGSAGEAILDEVIDLSNKLSTLDIEARTRFRIEEYDPNEDDSAISKSIASDVGKSFAILNGRIKDEPSFETALNFYKLSVLAHANYTKDKTLSLISIYANLLQKFPESTVLVTALKEALNVISTTFERIGVTTSRYSEPEAISPYYSYMNTLAALLQDDRSNMDELFARSDWPEQMIRNYLFVNISHVSVELTYKELLKIVDAIMLTLTPEDLEKLIGAFNSRKKGRSLANCLFDIKNGDKRYDLSRGHAIRQNWLGDNTEEA